jgi:hypothetical protein
MILLTNGLALLWWVYPLVTVNNKINKTVLTVFDALAKSAG